MTRYKVVRESYELNEKIMFLPGCVKWDDKPVPVVFLYDYADPRNILGKTLGVYREDDGWITVELSFELEKSHTLSFFANELSYDVVPADPGTKAESYTVFDSAQIRSISVIPPSWPRGPEDGIDVEYKPNA